MPVKYKEKKSLLILNTRIDCVTSHYKMSLTWYWFLTNGEVVCQCWNKLLIDLLLFEFIRRRIKFLSVFARASVPLWVLTYNIKDVKIWKYQECVNRLAFNNVGAT